MFLYNHFLNISSQLKRTGFVASHAFNVMVMNCPFQTVTVKHEWNFKNISQISCFVWTKTFATINIGTISQWETWIFLIINLDKTSTNFRT